jgi:hypothetical protein
MTVATATNKVVTPGNGLTTVFSYNFRIDTAADVQVTYTDTLGVSTILSASVYSVSGLALPGGGTVTYPLIGSPIASGTSLTIARVLPLTQLVSISNQGAFYPESVELAIDRAVMETQQISEEIGRTLVGPITDASPMTALPSAVQRASKVLMFDASGNPIAGSVLPAGTVSSAMQPVVAAASLSAGRLALGLGAAAVEGIGRGLQDDGAAKLRVDFHETAKSANYSIATTDHLEQFAVTGPVTFTLPATSTLWNGFGFWANVYGGTLTLAPNGADAIETNVTGVSSYIPANAKGYVSTNGAGVWKISRTRTTSSAVPPGGYLSLESGVVSSIGDVTSTTIYYNPDVHATAPVYNGSEWIDFPFSTLSCALNAAVHLPSVLHDVFLTLVNGAPTIVIGPAWRQSGFGNGYTGFTSLTNASPIVCTAAGHGLVNGDEVYFTGVWGNDAANGKWVVSGVAGSAFTLTGSVGNGAYLAATGTFSSRGNGAGTTQISKSGGLYTNAVQITAYNGVTPYTINAGLATYLGTIFIDTVAGQVTCHRSAGQARRWGVWNAFNRKNIVLRVSDPTVSWTNTTVNSYLVTNLDNNNSMRVALGLPEEPIDFSYTQNATGTSLFLRMVIGYASANEASGTVTSHVIGTTTTPVGGRNSYTSSPTIGAITIFELFMQVMAAGTMTLRGGSDDCLLTANFRA